jgi:hypothetical protein
MATTPNQQLAFPQPPYQTPMTDEKGMVTPAWNKWLQQLYIRVGGAATAPIQNFNEVPLTNIISAAALLGISTLYTSPIGQKTVINSLTVKNNDIVARTINIWFVVKGGMAGSTNIVVNAVSIAAGATQTFPALAFQVLNGGDFIQAQGSVTGLLNIAANARLTS